MTVSEIADRVIELVGDRAEAQVVVDGQRAGLTRFANSFIHQNVAEEGITLHLKLAAAGRVAGGTSQRVDEEGLAHLVDETLDAARHRPVDSEWPGLAPPAEPLVDVAYDEATATADPDIRAGKVKEFIDAGKGSLAAGYCDTAGGPVAFANSLGHRFLAHSSRATLDGIHQLDGAAGKAHSTSTRLEDIAAATVGSTAAAIARKAVGAIEVPPGDFEVVLSPECVSTILVFLAYYGWNAKSFEEGQSFVELQAQQFDPQVNVYDDPAGPLAVGWPFDFDGTPKQRVDLVTAGVSAGIVHDRRTAARMKAESTGHSVPGSDVFGPFAANLHFQPGKTSRDELIGAMARGLLITEFNYCRVLDPRSQVVTGLTRNGTFLVEDGEIVAPIQNLRFTQSFVDALSPGRVLGVGNDARLADGEFGAGLGAAPSIRLAGWHFSGGAQG